MAPITRRQVTNRQRQALDRLEREGIPFNKLPLEIRCMIWNEARKNAVPTFAPCTFKFKYSKDEKRHDVISLNPDFSLMDRISAIRSLLLVSREARDEIYRFFPDVLPLAGKGAMRFSSDHDIIHCRTSMNANILIFSARDEVTFWRGWNTRVRNFGYTWDESFYSNFRPLSPLGQDHLSVEEVRCYGVLLSVKHLTKLKRFLVFPDFRNENGSAKGVFPGSWKHYRARPEDQALIRQYLSGCYGWMGHEYVPSARWQSIGLNYNIDEALFCLEDALEARERLETASRHGLRSDESISGLRRGLRNIGSNTYGSEITLTDAQVGSLSGLKFDVMVQVDNEGDIMTTDW